MPCLFRKDNHKHTVQKCIESVKSNSKDYELIICDDGSPLPTDWMRIEADKFVRHKEPMGIAVGWNDGLRISRGKYKAVINDDIVAVKGWLEAMVEAFEKVEGALVTAPSVEKMPNGKGIEECRTWFPGSCFMFTEETIKKVGYFDEQFVPFNYEDVDYWTRVYKAGGKLARNYNVTVGHKEGQVIHEIPNNGTVDAENKEKYIKKWGFDPIPILYHGHHNFPWENK
jgi:GT2 family glycosyltransferase